MIDTAEMKVYRLLQWTLVICSVLIIGGMLSVFLFAAKTSDARCNELQDVRSYILGATNRAISSLPTLAYYKEHPDEQARALDNLREQRNTFERPLDCSIF